MKNDDDILREAMRRQPRERLTDSDHEHIMRHVMAAAQVEGVTQGTKVADADAAAVSCGAARRSTMAGSYYAAACKRQLWWGIAAGVVALLFVTGLGQRLIRDVLGWLLTPEDVARIDLPEIPWREVAGAVMGFFDVTVGLFKGAAQSLAALFARAAGTATHDVTNLARGAGNTMYIVIAACLLLLFTVDALLRKRVRH